MVGPPPKNPKTRQRRNKSSTDAHFEDGNPLAEFEIPALPEFGEGENDWTAAARDLWAEIWASPMREEYIRADVHRIVIYVRLYDKFVRSGSLAVLGELRLQGNCLGLTPIDRRRLGWVVSKKDPAARPERKKTERKPGHDTRGVLRAVT